MESSSIHFEMFGIARQLKQRLLAVPAYQRPYSWSTEQVTDYWADLRGAFTKKPREYFLGTIVLTSKALGSRDSIIDGQQRLATTTLLLAAIRHEYERRSDVKRASIVRDHFLTTADLETGEDVPRLRLSTDDDIYFRKILKDSSGAPPPSKLSHRLLETAHQHFTSEVSRIADEAGTEWATRLFEWVTFLTDEVRVIVLVVPTDSDAFLIFETLNDRGADLTIADLLKNYLFGRAGAQLDTVRDKWIQSLGALEMPAESTVFTTFLRHWWSSKRGAIRERELYKDIKERVSTELHALEFADELESAARLYAALLNTDHDYWSNLGTATKDNVETLLRFELEQNRPLLLAAMQHFAGPELKRLLRSLVNWAVRGIIVGGIGGGTFEKAYCAAAAKIRRGDLKSTDELFDELSRLIPTDEEFETAFAVAKVPKSNHARYYLSALQKAAAGQPDPELVPNADEEKVNLEHVLPRNAGAVDWGANFNADERKDWLFRLGNLALLQKGANAKIGNRPFSVKRPILVTSQLSLTSEIGERNDWSPQTILERQARLAEMAITVWPRKP